MQILKRHLLFAFFAGTALLTGCQKENSIEEPSTQPTTPTRDAVKDTTIGYTRDIYLWYNQIPASFDAQAYKDPAEIMTQIRQYSMEPGFTAPVDRWSFAIDKKSWDNASSGIAGDMGLSVFFNTSQGDLRVKYVEPASPAGKAGVRRGWRITKINGNTNMVPGNSDFIVDAVFYSPSASFTFVKPDNSTIDITLSAATYQEQPVLLDTVYQVNDKKIGYFVFNSFLGNQTQVLNRFSNLFSRFTSQNVTDVIVDLRYNGGGYVSLQEKLANYLAPAAANGTLMMTEKFNDKYASLDTSHFFKKEGSLNLTRVFFLVSDNTASASELLINNLKPVMDVVLVGPSNTYGKPVGYFNIPVGDWYIFPVSFRTVNQKGEGSYFNGLQVNHQVRDGLDKDWGDLDEATLATAVRYITTGKFTSIIRRREEEAVFQLSEINDGNKVLEQNTFKGMITGQQLR